MPAPASELLVNVRGTGGSQAAAEIGKVTGAQKQTAGAQKEVQNQFAKGISTTGLISLGREATIATGLSGALTTGIVGLITTLKAAMTGVGGLGVALSVVAAVAGTVVAAIAAFNLLSRQMTQALFDANTKLQEQDKLFRDLRKSGSTVTSSQKALSEITTQLQKEQIKLGTQLSVNIAREEAAAAAGEGWWRSLKKVWAQTINSEVGLKRLTIAQIEANKASLESLLNAQAQALGFKDNAARIKEMTDATNKTTTAVIEMSDALEQSEAAVRKFMVFDPRESGKFRNELNSTNAALKDQLGTIESGRRKRLGALDELIKKETTYNEKLAEFALTSEERRDALERLSLLESQHAQGRVQVNQWAANQVLLANAEASKKTEQMWFDRTAKMREAIQQVSVDLMESFRDSTKTAADAFRALGDFVINEVQRMIAAEIALQAARKTTAAISAAGGGGAGMFGGLLKGVVGAAGSLFSAGAGATGGGPMFFHSGGTVPGPMGQARAAIVHGGETINTPTGRGGGPPAAASSTQTYYIATGILTPDTLRTTQRQISRMQGSAGEQTFPVRR